MTWRHFPDHELRCRCACGLGVDDMAQRTMELLEAVRHGYGKPLPVTSAVRCHAHNAAVGGSLKSAHLLQADGTAHAIDLHVPDVMEALEVIRLALAVGFTGCGARIHGPRQKRTVHIDDLPRSAGRPRPALWTYR